ncbi:MAG: hypothetical protein AAGK14_06065 [Verrucomicrobiota bacterium]
MHARFFFLFLLPALFLITGCETTGSNAASNVDRTGPGAPIYTQGQEIDADYYDQL